MGDSISTIIKIWQTTGDYHGNLWMFYILVVSGILGFSFSESFARRALVSRVGLLVLLSAFLFANLKSIYDNLEIYNSSVRQLILISSGDLEPVTSSIKEISRTHLIALHLLLDASVLSIVGYRSFR